MLREITLAVGPGHLMVPAAPFAEWFARQPWTVTDLALACGVDDRAAHRWLEGPMVTEQAIERVGIVMLDDPRLSARLYPWLDWHEDDGQVETDDLFEQVELFEPLARAPVQRSVVSRRDIRVLSAAIREAAEREAVPARNALIVRAKREGLRNVDIARIAGIAPCRVANIYRESVAV